MEKLEHCDYLSNRSSKVSLLRPMVPSNNNSDKRFADQAEIAHVRRAVFRGPEERASVSFSASYFPFSKKNIISRGNLCAPYAESLLLRARTFHRCLSYFPRERHKQPFQSSRLYVNAREDKILFLDCFIISQNHILPAITNF